MGHVCGCVCAGVGVHACLSLRCIALPVKAFSCAPMWVKPFGPSTCNRHNLACWQMCRLFRIVYAASQLALTTHGLLCPQRGSPWAGPWHSLYSTNCPHSSTSLL